LQSEAPNSSLRCWRKPSVKVRHVTKVVVVIGCDEMPRYTLFRLTDRR